MRGREGERRGERGGKGDRETEGERRGKTYRAVYELSIVGPVALH